LLRWSAEFRRLGNRALMQNSLQDEEEEEKTYMFSPPINIHWVEATVLTAMAIISLGMLRILYIVMWLIEQGPILIQPSKQNSQHSINTVSC
jgi:hypothetical protein